MQESPSLDRFTHRTARRWKAALLLPWDLPPRAGVGVELRSRPGGCLVVVGPSCVATYRQEPPRA